MQKLTLHPKLDKKITIQVIRALCIIAVVMIHTSPGGEWQAYIRPFINFCVATFLFLSGYLTKDENEDWYSFLKKRILRVLIPYTLWTILYSIPQMILLEKNITHIVWNFFTTNACFPFYYIAVYIQFVLLTPLLSKLAKSKYKHLGWLISPISVVIFRYYGQYIEPEFNHYILSLWRISCLGWFTFYYLGLLLNNNIINVHYKLINLLIVYGLCILLQISEGYYWFLDGESECGSQLKLTSLLTSSIFCLCIHAYIKNNQSNVHNTTLKVLGDYSFGIYLCHVMIMTILHKIPYYSMLPFPINSLVVLLFSFFCCWIGDKICRRKVSSWLGLK